MQGHSINAQERKRGGKGERGEKERERERKGKKDEDREREEEEGSDQWLCKPPHCVNVGDIPLRTHHEANEAYFPGPLTCKEFLSS
jgi:hypothetical protein